MKKNLTFIFLCALFVAFVSCSEDDDAKGAFSVSGYVTYLNAPVEEATVSIDDKINLTATTDADGYFKITGVSSGDHQLTMSKTVEPSTNSSTDLAFTEKTVDLSVNEDIELNDLRLPKAVILYEVTGVTEIDSEIAWSPTDESEFREYKLYRHNTTGLDETTGLLIHVATSVNDTTFTDTDLTPLSDYYYRVFVLDDFGRIGGSNIIGITTEEAILLKNGGFESIENNVPVNWDFIESVSNQNEMTVNNTIAYEGLNSIEVNALDAQATTSMRQMVNGSLFKAGAEYELTFNYRSDASFNFDLEFRDAFRTPQVFSSGSWGMDATGSNWESFSTTIQVPNDLSEGDVSVRLSFHNFDTVHCYIDNVALKQLN